MVGTDTNLGTAMLERGDGSSLPRRASNPVRWRLGAAQAAHFRLVRRDFPVQLISRTRTVIAARSAFGWDPTIVDTLRT
jgi:hypothetical protein